MKVCEIRRVVVYLLYPQTRSLTIMEHNSLAISLYACARARLVLRPRGAVELKI